MAVEEIDSTFEETDRFSWAQREFRGTHTHGTVRLVREYVIERGTQFLEENTKGYVNDQLVSERADWEEVDLTTDSVAHTGMSIETFCRDRHFSAPEADLEYLVERYYGDSVKTLRS